MNTDKNTINNLLMEKEKLEQRINVLLDCLVTLRSGVVAAKEEVVFYAEAVSVCGGNVQVGINIPKIYIGRKFRIVLETEE